MQFIQGNCVSLKTDLVILLINRYAVEMISDTVNGVTCITLERIVTPQQLLHRILLSIFLQYLALQLAHHRITTH